MMKKTPMMEDEKYKEFFQSALKKFKVSGPDEFKSDEEKKKFFDYIDKNYKAKNEEVEEGFDPKKSLRHLATRGIGVFTKKEAVEALKTRSSFDYYDPNGDKKDGIIAAYDDSGFVVKDTKTGKKYDFKYYTPGMRVESTTELDEGVLLDEESKLELWEVGIKNNYYAGKYYEYDTRPYPVVARTKDEAEKVVFDNADDIINDLKSKKIMGRNLLSKKYTIAITKKEIGRVDKATHWTKRTGKVKTFSPDGPIEVLVKSGVIVNSLDEGVSPYRKTFITHATEIANKLRKANPDASAKDIHNGVRKVMLNMALDVDNPNYKNTTRYMPDKFDKKLYDNGGGNSYDSEWMKQSDAQMETVFKSAVKSLGLKESVNIDTLMLRISESL